MRRGAGPIIVIGIVAVALCFLFFVVVLAMFGGFRPASGPKGTTGRGTGSVTLSGQAYDCAGVSNVPKEYMPWIKEAADRYFGGDQALAIAVISVEAGSWNQKSINPRSGATGLGQFMAATAAGFTGKGSGFEGYNIYDIRTYYKLAKGSYISRETIQAFIAHPRYSRDGRLQGGPSIIAMAQLFSGHMKKYNGDVFTAYAKGYHTYTTAGQRAEAEKGAQRLVDRYNKLKTDGTCTTKDSKTNKTETINIIPKK